MADSNKIGLTLFAPNGVLNPIRDVQRAFHALDSRISSVLNLIGGEKFATFPTKSGGNAGNPEITIKMLKLVGNSLGKTGIAFFLAEQQLLLSQNAYSPKVYDPLYLVNRTIPGIHKERPLGLLQKFVDSKPGDYEQSIIDNENARMDSHLRINVPSFSVKQETGLDRVGPHQVVNQRSPRYTGANSQDDSMLPREIIHNPSTHGVFPGDKIVDAALKIRNRNNPEVEYELSPLVDVNEIVDNILDGKPNVSAVQGTPIQDDLSPGVSGRKKFNVSSLFQVDNKKLGIAPAVNPSERVSAQKNPFNNPLRQSSFPYGNVPASFQNEDERGSYLVKDGDDITSKISDDEAYVPLSFADMRPVGGQDGQTRVVYFRALNTSLQESFSPQWQTDSYYGRVDPVAIYKSTARSFNLTFECHAFYAEDVKAIYEKLTWLTSLVYPMYDNESIIKSGPVCRVRFGDVLKGRGNLGLPGFINNLEFDYSESLWELKKGSKVPRSIKVSLGFSVLHDMPIGRREDGKFGGIGKFGTDNKYIHNNASIDPDAFRGFGQVNEKETTSNVERDNDRIVDTEE